MLFILFGVYAFQQWVAVKRGFITADEGENDPAVLWSYGSLTMPSTQTISHDVRLASAVPAAAFVLWLFWLFVYVWFEDDRSPLFDDTFWNGVDKSEMDSFSGVVDNIAAQASWRCFTLLAFGLFLPAYPLSATSLWIGAFKRCTKWNDQKIGLATDISGTLATLACFLIGIYETFWDDDNGIGIWHLFNSSVLLVFTVPRLFTDFDKDASGHEVMGRSCYQEKEQEGAAVSDQITSTETPAKEQELSETPSGSEQQGDDSVPPPESEIV